MSSTIVKKILPYIPTTLIATIYNFKKIEILILCTPLYHNINGQKNLSRCCLFKAI